MTPEEQYHKEARYKCRLLQLVMDEGGEITFSQPFDGFIRIKGVWFENECEDKVTDSTEGWNAFVQEVRAAIGVQYYCEWVRDAENNLVGLLAFYDQNGEEIKTKHYRTWSLLYHALSN